MLRHDKEQRRPLGTLGGHDMMRQGNLKSGVGLAVGTAVIKEPVHRSRHPSAGARLPSCQASKVLV